MPRKGDPEIYKRGKKFSKTYQPSGEHKRNKFLHLREKYELNKRDVETIIEYIMCLTTDEIDKLSEDPTVTVIEKAFAAAVMEAIKKGDLSQIDRMLDRKIGKVVQNMTVDTNINFETQESKLLAIADKFKKRVNKK